MLTEDQVAAIEAEARQTIEHLTKSWGADIAERVATNDQAVIDLCRDWRTLTAERDAAFRERDKALEQTEGSRIRAEGMEPHLRHVEHYCDAAIGLLLGFWPNTKNARQEVLSRIDERVRAKEKKPMTNETSMQDVDSERRDEDESGEGLYAERMNDAGEIDLSL